MAVVGNCGGQDDIWESWSEQQFRPPFESKESAGRLGKEGSFGENLTMSSSWNPTSKESKGTSFVVVLRCFCRVFPTFELHTCVLFTAFMCQIVLSFLSAIQTDVFLSKCAFDFCPSELDCFPSLSVLLCSDPLYLLLSSSASFSPLFGAQSFGLMILKIEPFYHNQQRCVWREQGAVFHKNKTWPSVKHGDGSVMLWGCVAASGTETFQE